MKGFFAALAEALKFLNWWAPRKAAKNDDPENKISKWNQAVNNEILNDDATAANARIDDALARLRVRDKRAGDSSGSGDSKN